MMNSINLPAIYIANLLGILVMLLMLSGSGALLRQKGPESFCLSILTVTSVLCCVTDPVLFLLDGLVGPFAYWTLLIGNSLLFIENMAVGPLWLAMIYYHISGSFPRKQQLFCLLLCGTGLIMLAVNLFTPVIFTIASGNHYVRGPFYWIYMGIQVVLLADSALVYLKARREGGPLKFYPLWQFLIPILLSIIIQGLFYGVSLVWPCLSIAICAVMNSLKTEYIHRDQLTGLFNRFYLDYVKDHIDRSPDGRITAMMLDMNDFKSINDHYGHTEGDRALVATANVLSTSVGMLGSILRYAGDEFVILLNTADPVQAEYCLHSIRANLDAYNRTSGKPYSLSFSAGVCCIDLKAHTIEDLLHEIDARMYEEKRLFHSESGKRKSRKKR